MQCKRNFYRHILKRRKTTYLVSSRKGQGMLVQKRFEAPVSLIFIPRFIRFCYLRLFNCSGMNSSEVRTLIMSGMSEDRRAVSDVSHRYRMSTGCWYSHLHFLSLIYDNANGLVHDLCWW